MQLEEPSPVDVAILLVCDGLEAATPVLARHGDHGRHLRLEAVLSLVGGGRVEPEAVAALGYARVCIVDGGDGELDVAEARGIRAATAPWIVLAQVHVLPHPGCLAAFLAARRTGSWAVIGPSFVDAAPRQPSSRVFLRLNYGQWTRESFAGPRDNVAAHNSAYDRAVLLALGGDLDPLLEAGWGLILALKARGHRLYLAPEACVELAGPDRADRLVRKMFSTSRRSTGQRCADWSRLRRGAFAAGTTVLPLVRGFGLLQDDLRHRRPIRLRELPLLLLALAASAAGEAAGALLGPGRRTRFRPPASGKTVDRIQQPS